MYLIGVIRTSILSYSSRSDVERWVRKASLNPNWDSRTKLIASLIPEGSSVLEFGAGRLVLKQFLPASCRYTPSDIVDRGEGTIVCDLNGVVLPRFPSHDFVIFGGVLEYIFDLDRLLAHLTNTCRFLVASYAATDFPRQRSAIQRRRYGWVNDFSKKDISNLFSSHGFIIERVLLWENQYVIKFVNNYKAEGG